MIVTRKSSRPTTLSKAERGSGAERSGRSANSYVANFVRIRNYGASVLSYHPNGCVEEAMLKSWRLFDVSREKEPDVNCLAMGDLPGPDPAYR